MEKQAIKTLSHFSLELDVPAQTVIQPYVSEHKKKDKKNKEKYNKFTYYKVGDQLTKVLYKDDKALYNQGCYPFVKPAGKLEMSKNLGDKNPQRLTTSEAAYIGHSGKTLYVMKMKEVPLEKGKLEIESEDIATYETIQIGNQ